MIRFVQLAVGLGILLLASAQRSAFFVFVDEGIQIVDPELQSIINTVSLPEFPVYWAPPSLLITYPYPEHPTYSESYITVNTSSYSLLLNPRTRNVDYARTSSTDSKFEYQWVSPVLGNRYLALPDSTPNSLTIFDTTTSQGKSVELMASIQHVLWVPASSPLPPSAQQYKSAAEIAVMDTCTYNTDCVQCVPRNSTQYCPDPGKCGYDPVVSCVGCMNGMAMPPGCPYPGACGFKGQTGCVNCQSGVSTDDCPDPSACGFASIPQCTMCMSGMCMPDCPWPQLCPKECPGCVGPADCAQCVAGEKQPGCPDPSQCGVIYYNTDCVQCMDRMEMPYCVDPGKCGFDPIVTCVNCMNGMAMPPGCLYPGACGYKGQPGCVDCVSRTNTSTCPDPGACGFAYIPQCDGCQSGTWEVGCPYPDHCDPNKYAPLPNCGGCVAGKPSDTCPDPTKCGMKTPCDDCMCGMFMPTCPDPSACGIPCGADTCMMESTFGFSHDVCILFSSWHVTDTGTYVAAVVCVLALCAIREWLSVHRTYVAMKCKPRTSETLPINNYSSSSGELSSKSGGRFKNNVINAIWYLLGLIAAYTLMLVIMTYEAGLFITVVIGCGVMHFVFHMAYDS